MKVTVVSKELIVPSSATPPDLKTYTLSYIDQQLPPYYVPFILYYSRHPRESTSNITIKLKASLSHTLTHFYPFAGRLHIDQTTIDCTDQGVLFVVAQVHSSLSGIINSPIIQELSQLVLVGPSYVEEQLAIQVNLFDCGGIALGICMSHRIADACSISSFLTHWFALTKGESETPLVGPLLNSAALFPPVDSYQYSRNPRANIPLQKLVTKRFVFSPLTINRLNFQVVKDSGTLVMNPTRVELVTALIWKCGTAALGDCKASVAFHTVNFRRKMVPPLQDQQFGNIFQMATAVTNQTEDMASLVAKLRASFGKINGEYLNTLTCKNGAQVSKANFRQIRKFMMEEDVGVFRFSSWCRFAVNEGDFGWGKPVWISSTNFNDENCIILMDSRCDDGIEAWVVMNEEHMKKFEQNAELQAYIASTTG